MPLTRQFKDTVKKRAERDPEFRIGLLREAIEALINDDLVTGKALLRDYINATIGFEYLAAELDKQPKSLMRMLSAKGHPLAENLLMIVGYLKKKEGVEFNLIINDNLGLNT